MTLAAVVAFLKRIGAWLAARPMVAGGIALGAAFLGMFGKWKLAERRAAKAEQRATVATVEGKVAVIAEQRHHAEGELKDTAAQLEQLDAKGEAAKGRQEQARQGVDDILDRHRRKP